MRILLAIALLLPALATAEVYKCDGPDGPVFSDVACGSGAEQIDVGDALATSGLGVPVSMEVRNDLMRARNARQRGYYINRVNDRRDRDLAEIDKQIAALNYKKSLANNNLAGATYAAGIDQQIAALRGSRALVQDSYRQRTIEGEIGAYK